MSGGGDVRGRVKGGNECAYARVMKRPVASEVTSNEEISCLSIPRSESAKVPSSDKHPDSITSPVVPF